MILCISMLSVEISPFSFLIVLIWFFSLFSWWDGLMVCLFHLSSQRTSFYFCWFSLLTPLFLFHLFLLLFLWFISFYWLWGSSFLIFLVALGARVGYLFYVSLVSWGKLVLLKTFLLLNKKLFLKILVYKFRGWYG